VGWVGADVAAPMPGEGELLVEVAAAALNHADLLMRAGRYDPASADWTVAPNRVGFEMAGLVRAVGEAVTGWSVGDPVMAQTGGACAELVTVPADRALPTRCSPLVEAAALPPGVGGGGTWTACSPSGVFTTCTWRAIWIRTDSFNRVFVPWV